MNPEHNLNDNLAGGDDKDNGQISSRLKVPVISPTHFDQPLEVTRGIKTEETKEVEGLKKTVKKFGVLAILFGVLGVAGIGFGAGGMIYGLNNIKQLEQEREKAKGLEMVVKQVEENTGIEPLLKPEQVPTYKPVKGYVYLDEWGVKMKVPDGLIKLSYTLDQKFRPTVCFSGMGKGTTTFPAFADIQKNPKGMGCLVRVETKEGNIDTGTNLSFGMKILTHKEYSYFYQAGEKDFSTEAGEKDLEKTAKQLIKQMISGVEIYE